jgi:hypothetical protein
MRLHIDEDRSIVVRHQPMERVDSADPDAVTRAIEDLGRSGYRPLRPRPPDPASMKHAWDGGAGRDAGEPSPLREDES